MKNICFIINPQSGKDYPILSVADRIFKTGKIEWHPAVITKEHEAVEFTKQAIADKVDAVVVYGGDGTVMEVTRALQRTGMPLLIVPGGTANVLSKEIGLPQEPEAVLQMFAEGKLVPQLIDMGMVNGQPFVLRINIGLLADMVVHTDRERKDLFGNFAYMLTALQNYPQRENLDFMVTIGNSAMKLEGVSLVITNAGNIGLSGMQFDSHISVTDGKLDVLLIKEGDIGSMTQLLAGLVTQTKPPVLEHWHGQNIHVQLDKPRSIIIDDEVKEMDELNISIDPQSLTLLIPKR